MQPNDRPEHAANVLSVLLVEDNPINQKVTILGLQRNGHLVRAVSNGKEAIDAYRDQDFDLILMDLQMPEMDGYQTTRTIREMESGTDSHTPIIALTAHVMPIDRSRCLEAGMDDYVSKPFSPDDLDAAIQRCLGTHQDSEPATSVPAAQGIECDIVFDEQEFGRRCQSDFDLMRELVDVFLAESNSALKSMQESLTRSAHQDVYTYAHAIKGMVGVFSAVSAIGSAERLEQLLLSDSQEGVADHVQDLENQVFRLRKALQDRFTNRSGVNQFSAE